MTLYLSSGSTAFPYPSSYGVKVHETGTISGHQNWHWKEHETGRALPPDRIAWASRDRVDPRPDLSRSDVRGARDFWLSASLMPDSLPVSRSLSCQFRAPSHHRATSCVTGSFGRLRVFRAFAYSAAIPRPRGWRTALRGLQPVREAGASREALPRL